jgi:hypothetical protein
MHVEVKKIHWNGCQCSNENCKQLPQYIHYVEGPYHHSKMDWYIKPDTIVAFVGSGPHSIYCRDCIDELYLMLKSKLDSKLWSFQ